MARHRSDTPRGATLCQPALTAQLVPPSVQIKVTDAGVEVGACVTLTQLGASFKELIASRPGHETASLQAVVHQLRWFAGNQIRNVSHGAGFHGYCAVLAVLAVLLYCLCCLCCCVMMAAM